MTMQVYAFAYENSRYTNMNDPVRSFLDKNGGLLINHIHSYGSKLIPEISTGVECEVEIII